MRKRKILLDTSFLMALIDDPGAMPSELVVEVGAANLYVPSVVITELRGITRNRSVRRRRMAERALAYAANMEIVEIEAGRGKVDETIADYATKHRHFVATNDGVLRKQLRKRGVSVLGYRGKGKRVVLYGSSLG